MWSTKTTVRRSSGPTTENCPRSQVELYSGPARYPANPKSGSDYEYFGLEEQNVSHAWCNRGGHFIYAQRRAELRRDWSQMGNSQTGAVALQGELLGYGSCRYVRRTHARRLTSITRTSTEAGVRVPST